MTRMRIAVTGKAGQVVTSLLDRAAGRNDVEVIAVGRPEFDLARPETVLDALAATRPNVIVSAAAWTAVDLAESERNAAFAANATGAEAVGRAARALGVPVIHLSTDYVYDGSKLTPWMETDPTGPLSVYGTSKLEGEILLARAQPDHAILRTAWVYSPFGANFVVTMLKMGVERNQIRVVGDQFGSPTSALDIAEAILVLAQRLTSDQDPTLRGIFHLAGQGETSWAEFALAIFSELKKRTGRSVAVESITTAEFPRLAKRPANSRLDGSKLKKVYGIELPHWRQSLNVVLDRLIRI